MGYSCSAKASSVYDNMLEQLQAASATSEPLVGNGWAIGGQMYFAEIGKEQHDAAITGTVHIHIGHNHCRKHGSFRIDSHGRIARWPTSTKAQREAAMTAGLIKYHQRFKTGWNNDAVLCSLIGNAQFVVI